MTSSDSLILYNPTSKEPVDVTCNTQSDTKVKDYQLISLRQIEDSFYLKPISNRVKTWAKHRRQENLWAFLMGWGICLMQESEKKAWLSVDEALTDLSPVWLTVRNVVRYVTCEPGVLNLGYLLKRSQWYRFHRVTWECHYMAYKPCGWLKVCYSKQTGWLFVFLFFSHIYSLSIISEVFVSFFFQRSNLALN